MGLWCCGRRVVGWVFLLCTLPSLSLLAQEPVLSPVEGEGGGKGQELRAKGQELSPEPSAIGPEPFYVYDPAGKRDPFLPMLGVSLRKSACAEEPQTPLQVYEVGQLKLVGIIWNLEEPRALVEDGAGMGYIITRGTPIGSSCGVVKRIEPGQVVVEEYYYDFYGDRQAQEVVMELAALPGEEGEKK